MEKNYRIFDAHCHIYPEKIVDKAVPATDRFYSVVSRCRGTIDDLMAENAEAGIDCSLVESVATTPKQVPSINRFIAETVAGHQGKAYGVGTLHPDCEDMEKEVRYIIDLGLLGVKLHPEIQGFKVDEERCMPIYELCTEYRLPLLMHTGDKRYDCSNPDRLKPLLKRFDRLTVIGAHFGGWSIWEEAYKDLAGLPNLYVDCSSSFYSLTRPAARKVIEAYGVDRVLFGTDYPMWKPKEELEYLLSLGFSKEDNQKMLWDNAAKVFRIKA